MRTQCRPGGHLPLSPLNTFSLESQYTGNPHNSFVLVSYGLMHHRAKIQTPRLSTRLGSLNIVQLLRPDPNWFVWWRVQQMTNYQDTKHGTQCQGGKMKMMWLILLFRDFRFYVVRPEVAPDSCSGEAELSPVWEIKRHPLMLEPCLSASYFLGRSQTKVSATAKVSTLSSSSRSETSERPTMSSRLTGVKSIRSPQILTQK